MPRLVSHPDEVKIVSRRFGQGAADIDKYIELGGYEAAKKCLAQGPDWIIDEMKASNLRGRGGAGFPTGMKWSFVPKQSAKPKYVLVNGDESEPGTCKDHLIFLHDPHAVIEGTIIAGLAIGAKTGFIYLRGEYRYLLEIMEKAVADAYARGFLGKEYLRLRNRISDHHANRRRRLRSGRRIGAHGVARRQAWSPAHQASLPRCRRPLWRPHRHQQRRDHRHRSARDRHGRARLCRDWLAAQRWHTRLFCVSGHVERPGVYELPMGYNLKKMIYEVAGGVRGGRKLKAVVPGGSSTPVLLPEEIETLGMDFDQVGQSRIDARLRRRCCHRRPDLHRRVRAPHHQLLSARKLRLVHPLPRGYRLAQEVA